MPKADRYLVPETGMVMQADISHQIHKLPVLCIKLNLIQRNKLGASSWLLLLII